MANRTRLTARSNFLGKYLLGVGSFVIFTFKYLGTYLRTRALYLKISMNIFSDTITTTHVYPEVGIYFVPHVRKDRIILAYVGHVLSTFLYKYGKMQISLQI